MKRKFSTAAVLLLTAAFARAEDPAPRASAAPDIAETHCADDPGTWAPGLGLEAPKQGVVDNDFLALCRAKKTPRPGFPSGAPDDGHSGVVQADPVAQAQALQRQAEDYSRTEALRKKVGGLSNPWGGAPEPPPSPAAGADLLSPKTAMPPQSFQKVPLNSVPALPQRLQAAAPAVAAPLPAAAAAPKTDWKGKVCEELPQFVSPKVTWCHPAGATPR